jgi:hypothetical protein
MNLVSRILGKTNTLVYIQYICYDLSSKTLNEQQKQPERVVANAKQPRREISRRGRFVTATTRSGK